MDSVKVAIGDMFSVIRRSLVRRESLKGLSDLQALHSFSPQGLPPVSVREWWDALPSRLEDIARSLRQPVIDASRWPHSATILAPYLEILVDLVRLSSPTSLGSARAALHPHLASVVRSAAAAALLITSRHSFRSLCSAHLTSNSPHRNDINRCLLALSTLASYVAVFEPRMVGRSSISAHRPTLAAALTAIMYPPPTPFPPHIHAETSLTALYGVSLALSAPSPVPNALAAVVGVSVLDAAIRVASPSTVGQVMLAACSQLETALAQWSSCVASPSLSSPMSSSLSIADGGGGDDASGASVTSPSVKTAGDAVATLTPAAAAVVVADRAAEVASVASKISALLAAVVLRMSVWSGKRQAALAEWDVAEGEARAARRRERGAAWRARDDEGLGEDEEGSGPGLDDDAARSSEQWVEEAETNDDGTWEGGEEGEGDGGEDDAEDGEEGGSLSSRPSRPWSRDSEGEIDTHARSVRYCILPGCFAAYPLSAEGVHVHASAQAASTVWEREMDVVDTPWAAVPPSELLTKRLAEQMAALRRTVAATTALLTIAVTPLAVGGGTVAAAASTVASVKRCFSAHMISPTDGAGLLGRVANLLQDAAVGERGVDGRGGGATVQLGGVGCGRGVVPLRLVAPSSAKTAAVSGVGVEGGGDCVSGASASASSLPPTLSSWTSEWDVVAGGPSVAAPEVTTAPTSAGAVDVDVDIDATSTLRISSTASDLTHLAVGVVPPTVAAAVAALQTSIGALSNAAVNARDPYAIANIDAAAAAAAAASPAAWAALPPAAAAAALKAVSALRVVNAAGCVIAEAAAATLRLAIAADCAWRGAMDRWYATLLECLDEARAVGEDVVGDGGRNESLVEMMRSLLPKGAREAGGLVSSLGVVWTPPVVVAVAADAVTEAFASAATASSVALRNQTVSSEGGLPTTTSAPHPCSADGVGVVGVAPLRCPIPTLADAFHSAAVWLTCAAQPSTASDAADAVERGSVCELDRVANFPQVAALLKEVWGAIVSPTARETAVDAAAAAAALGVRGSLRVRKAVSESSTGTTPSPTAAEERALDDGVDHRVGWLSPTLWETTPVAAARARSAWCGTFDIPATRSFVTLLTQCGLLITAASKHDLALDNAGREDEGEVEGMRGGGGSGGVGVGGGASAVAESGGLTVESGVVSCDGGGPYVHHPIMQFSLLPAAFGKFGTFDALLLAARAASPDRVAPSPSSLRGSSTLGHTTPPEGDGGDDDEGHRTRRTDPMTLRPWVGKEVAKHLSRTVPPPRYEFGLTHVTFGEMGFGKAIVDLVVGGAVNMTTTGDVLLAGGDADDDDDIAGGGLDDADTNDPFTSVPAGVPSSSLCRVEGGGATDALSVFNHTARTGALPHSPSRVPSWFSSVFTLAPPPDASAVRMAAAVKNVQTPLSDHPPIRGALSRVMKSQSVRLFDQGRGGGTFSPWVYACGLEAYTSKSRSGATVGWVLVKPTHLITTQPPYVPPVDEHQSRLGGHTLSSASQQTGDGVDEDSLAVQSASTLSNSSSQGAPLSSFAEGSSPSRPRPLTRPLNIHTPASRLPTPGLVIDVEPRRGVSGSGGAEDGRRESVTTGDSVLAPPIQPAGVRRGVVVPSTLSDVEVAAVESAAVVCRDAVATTTTPLAIAAARSFSAVRIAWPVPLGDSYDVSEEASSTSLVPSGAGGGRGAAVAARDGGALRESSRTGASLDISAATFSWEVSTILDGVGFAHVQLLRALGAGVVISQARPWVKLLVRHSSSIVPVSETHHTRTAAADVALALGAHGGAKGDITQVPPKLMSVARVALGAAARRSEASRAAGRVSDEGFETARAESLMRAPSSIRDTSSLRSTSTSSPHAVRGALPAVPPATRARSVASVSQTEEDVRLFVERLTEASTRSEILSRERREKNAALKRGGVVGADSDGEAERDGDGGEKEGVQTTAPSMTLGERKRRARGAALESVRIVGVVVGGSDTVVAIGGERESEAAQPNTGTRAFEEEMEMVYATSTTSDAPAVSPRVATSMRAARPLEEVKEDMFDDSVGVGGASKVSARALGRGALKGRSEGGDGKSQKLEKETAKKVSKKTEKKAAPALSKSTKKGRGEDPK